MKLKIIIAFDKRIAELEKKIDECISSEQQLILEHLLDEVKQMKKTITNII